MSESVKLSIEKYGGPYETNNIQEWNREISNTNKTWKVIDSGDKHIAIWDVLEMMDENDAK